MFGAAALKAAAGVERGVEMGKLPEISPGLLRFVAMRVAKLTLEQWKALPAEERKRMRVEIRPILMFERRYLNRKLAPGATGEKPKPAPGKARP